MLADQSLLSGASCLVSWTHLVWNGQGGQQLSEPDFNRTQATDQQFRPGVAGTVLHLPNGTACSPNGSDSSHLPPGTFSLQGDYIGTFSSVCTKSIGGCLSDSGKRSHGWLSDENPTKRANMTNIEGGTEDVSSHKLTSRTLAGSFKLLEKSSSAKSKSPSKRQSSRGGSPSLSTPTKHRGSVGATEQSSPTVNGVHENCIKMKDCRVALKRLTEEEIVRHSPKAKLMKRQRVSDSDSSDWATPRKRQRSGNRKPIVLSDDSDTDNPVGGARANRNNTSTESSTCTYAVREAIKKRRCQRSLEDPRSVIETQAASSLETLRRSVDKGMERLPHVGNTKESVAVVSDDHTSSKGQAESEEDSAVISDGRISSKDMSDDALPDLELISYCPAVKERYSSDDLPDLEIIDAYFPSATSSVSIPVIKKEPCDERTSDSTRSCAESPVQWRRKHRKVMEPKKSQTLMTDYKLSNDCGLSVSRPQSSLKKKKKTFGQHRSNMLNSCEDAEDYDAYLYLIKSFTTRLRANSPDTTKFIIKEILLKSKSETITSEAFQVLEHVQNLHPFEIKSESDAKWFWTLLQTLCKNLGLTEESAAPLNVVSFYNNAHALQYLVKLCENDLRRHLKSQQQSLVRQFSSERHYQKVEEILRWTVNSVELEHLTVTDNSCNSPKRKSQSSSRASRTVSFGNIAQVNAPSCLQSLQKLLLLVEEASDSPYNDCRTIGNELLTSYICLPRLRDCRMLLQTMQAHQLRLWFLEVMFFNQCNDYSQGLPLSVTKITKSFFKCKPRALAEVEEVGDDKMAPVREACEELAMSLFFILQSYTRVKMGQHHPTSSVPRGMTPSTSMEHSLSSSDLQALEQMPTEVERLKLRLEDLCSPLSKRTHNYLQQMVVLGKSVHQGCRRRGERR